MSDQYKAAALAVAAQIVKPIEGETPAKQADRIVTIAVRIMRKLDKQLEPSSADLD